MSFLLLLLQRWKLLIVDLRVLPRSGYRIRELSEAEREVQVSQLVARQREWENGLVSTYKKFLEICAAEVKGASASPRPR